VKLQKKKKTFWIDNSQPWYTAKAIKFLGEIITEDSRVLETGTGGSTFWFAERAKEVVSFEHNKKWFEIIKKRLKESGIENVNLIFDPRYRKAGIGGVKGFFDIIAVDGRGRVRSIITGRQFLSPGGYLLLDNSDRKRYKKALILLSGWKRWDFWNEKWRTTIWRKSKR